MVSTSSGWAADVPRTLRLWESLKTNMHMQKNHWGSGYHHHHPHTRWKHSKNESLHTVGSRPHTQSIKKWPAYGITCVYINFDQLVISKRNRWTSVFIWGVTQGKMRAPVNLENKDTNQTQAWQWGQMDDLQHPELMNCLHTTVIHYATWRMIISWRA